MARKTTGDIVIIGAGAAGLAATVELAAAGRAIHIIEARDRIGGRICTRREPDVPIPIELGAEFIHGASPEILDWLRRANEPFADATQTRWMSVKGKLQPADDVFEEMKRELKSVRRPRKDLPFGQFLDEVASRRLSARSQAFARLLVEGFDAADTSRVSTFEILEEWSGDGAADAPTFRPLNGYGALIQSMVSNVSTENVRVHLNTTVREIHWKRGQVRIIASTLGESVEIEAPKAIVTLPLGVLQLPSHAPGGVSFRPALASKQEALAQLASGPVIKVILRFRSPFWETLDAGKYRGAAFFQSAESLFPTYWTSLPARSSLIVAWTAGPNAARLAGSNEHDIVRAALDGLESVFGSSAPIRECFVGAYCHDWQADMFACGAYSYVVAGGASAREALAQPAQNTLFFAGEAAEFESEAATVAGALRSGQRAARQVLRAIAGAQHRHKRR
jgi:monoamine oxidase